MLLHSIDLPNSLSIGSFLSDNPKHLWSVNLSKIFLKLGHQGWVNFILSSLTSNFQVIIIFYKDVKKCRTNTFQLKIRMLDDTK